MKPIENCQNCSQKFDSKAYKNTGLENGMVVTPCANCGHKNVIIEKAECDWPFSIEGVWTLGSSCENPPIVVFPYKSLSGVKYRCVCRTHLVNEKHCVPVRAIISEETKEVIEREIKENRPVAYSLYYAFGLGLLVFGPLMVLYSLLGAVSRFAQLTLLPFVWLCLGLTWWIMVKTNPFNVPLSRNKEKRVVRVWIILLIIICGVAFIFSRF